MCERQPCPTWLLALAGSTTNGQLAMILYIMWLYFTSQSYVSMFLSLHIRFREMCIKQLQSKLQTGYSCSYNVTERSFRAHWIPQCGPGNKAADGELYASHTPSPSRLQHPWTSYSAPTKSEDPPPPYERTMPKI